MPAVLEGARTTERGLLRFCRRSRGDGGRCSTTNAAVTMIPMPTWRLRVGRFLQPILLQSQIELSAREAEALGGSRPVPAALAQDLRNGLALDRAEVGRGSTWWFASAF